MFHSFLTFLPEKKRRICFPPSRMMSGYFLESAVLSRVKKKIKKALERVKGEA
jgi:hypothetical protein